MHEPTPVVDLDLVSKLHRSRPWLAARKAGKDPEVLYRKAVKLALIQWVVNSPFVGLNLLTGKPVLALFIAGIVVQNFLLWRKLRADKPAFLAKTAATQAHYAAFQARRLDGSWQTALPSPNTVLILPAAAAAIAIAHRAVAIPVGDWLAWIAGGLAVGIAVVIADVTLHLRSMAPDNHERVLFLPATAVRPALATRGPGR